MTPPLATPLFIKVFAIKHFQSIFNSPTRSYFLSLALCHIPAVYYEFDMLRAYASTNSTCGRVVYSIETETTYYI